MGHSDEISGHLHRQSGAHGLPDLFGFHDLGPIFGPTFGDPAPDGPRRARTGPQNGAGKLEMPIKISCGEVSRGAFSREKVRMSLIKGLAIIFPQITPSGASFTGIL